MQTGLVDPGRLTSSLWLKLFGVTAALLLGVALALDPSLAVPVLGAPPIAFLLSRGALTRAVVVLLGGLTLLMVSPGVSLQKFAYLAILLVATFYACISIAGRWAAVQAIGAAPLLVVSGAVAAIVGLSALVAVNSGTPFEAWVLDVPAYAMLVVAVILGIDIAASGHEPRHIMLVLLLAGLVSGAGYAAHWTYLHGVTQLDVGRYLFASQFLPAAAFCLAIANVFDGRWKYRMALIATALVLAMLVSATRISILFAIPVIVTLAVARGRRWSRVAVLAIVAGFTFALVAQLPNNVTTGGYFNLAVVQARLTGIIPLLASQDITADGSLYARYLETISLQNVWSHSPWLGVGPGASYSDPSIVRAVDSPLAILARFGVIGTTVFAIFFAALLASKLRRGAHWVPATALLAFVSLIAAWSLLSSPLDDKGVALGLIPLIGLCGTWRRPTGVSPQAPLSH